MAAIAVWCPFVFMCLHAYKHTYISHTHTYIQLNMGAPYVTPQCVYTISVCDTFEKSRK